MSSARHTDLPSPLTGELARCSAATLDIAFVADLLLTGPGTNAPPRVEGHIGSVLARSGDKWEVKRSVVSAAPSAPGKPTAAKP